MKMLLKSEGYHAAEKLAERADRFISQFTHKKNQILYGEQAANSEFIDQVTEKLVLRDVRVAVRFAILLRNQEWSGYRDSVLFRRQERQWKFEPALYEKPLAEKETALAAKEKQAERALEEKARIETETLREGFRNILRVKFFNEWRAAKQEQLARKRDEPKGVLDEVAAERDLLALIVGTFDAVGERMAEEERERPSKQEEEQAAALLVLGPQGTLSAPAAEAAKQSAATKPSNQRLKRRLTHSASTVGLNFAAQREADESEFMARVEGAFA